MLNDVFVEYMIKKKTGPKDILISVGVVLAGAVLIFIGLLFTGVMPMIPFLVLCGVIYGAYRLISMRNLEF